jgi:hypothetical protein
MANSNKTETNSKTNKKGKTKDIKVQELNKGITQMQRTELNKKANIERAAQVQPKAVKTAEEVLASRQAKAAVVDEQWLIEAIDIPVNSKFAGLRLDVVTGTGLMTHPSTWAPKCMEFFAWLNARVQEARVARTKAANAPKVVEPLKGLAALSEVIVVEGPAPVKVKRAKAKQEWAPKKGNEPKVTVTKADTFKPGPKAVNRAVAEVVRPITDPIKAALRKAIETLKDVE